MFSRIRPSLVDVWTKLTIFGRFRATLADSGQICPSLTNTGRARPDFGHSGRGYVARSVPFYRAPFESLPRRGRLLEMALDEFEGGSGCSGPSDQASCRMRGQRLVSLAGGIAAASSADCFAHGSDLRAMAARSGKFAVLEWLREVAATRQARMGVRFALGAPGGLRRLILVPQSLSPELLPPKNAPEQAQLSQNCAPSAFQGKGAFAPVFVEICLFWGDFGLGGLLKSFSIGGR